MLKPCATGPGAGLKFALPVASKTVIVHAPRLTVVTTLLFNGIVQLPLAKYCGVTPDSVVAVAGNGGVPYGTWGSGAKVMTSVALSIVKGCGAEGAAL